MKNLHPKSKFSFSVPSRMIFEGPEDIMQSADAQMSEAQNKISTDLETTTVEQATVAAKKKIDDITKTELAKLKPNKEAEADNKEYITRLLTAQKNAKEAIDKNVETYRNVQKYLKGEAETKILLKKIKDVNGDKSKDTVITDGKEALALLAQLRPLSTKLDAKSAGLREIDLMNDLVTQTRRDDFFSNQVDTPVNDLNTQIANLRDTVRDFIGKEVVSTMKGDTQDDPTTKDFDESSVPVLTQLQIKGIVPLKDVHALEDRAKEVDGLLTTLKQLSDEPELLEAAQSMSITLHQNIDEAHKSMAESDKSGKLAKEVAKLPQLKLNFEQAQANRQKLLNASAEEKNSPDYKQKLNNAYAWYKNTQKLYGDQQLKVYEMEGDVDKLNSGTGVYEKGIFDEEVPALTLNVNGVDKETATAVDWLDSVGSGRRITVDGVNIYVDRIARKGENQFSISTSSNKELGLKKDIQGSKEFILKEIVRIAAEKKPKNSGEENSPSAIV